jgi:Flp pilus assembly protein TadG
MTTTRVRGDRGSVITEMVIIVPVAIALMCLVALVGRTTVTRQVLDGAARDAARAASAQRTPGAARAAAAEAVNAALDRSGLHCATHTVDLDTSRFEPGGQVTAVVGCEVSLADLGPIGLGGTRRFDGHATSVLDTYRATGDTP